MTYHIFLWHAGCEWAPVQLLEALALSPHSSSQMFVNNILLIVFQISDYIMPGRKILYVDW